jgi:hypothetical protein
MIVVSKNALTDTGLVEATLEVGESAEDLRVAGKLILSFAEWNLIGNALGIGAQALEAIPPHKSFRFVIALSPEMDAAMRAFVDGQAAETH